MSDAIKYYDFTESQYVVRQGEQLIGKTYSNITILVNFEQDDIDPDIMENAINQAIERFPSAKLRIHEFKLSELEKIEGPNIRISDTIAMMTPKGKEPIIPRQYFADECGVTCQRMTFKNDKKMYKFINKLVHNPFPNKYNDCPLFKVFLVQRENGRYAALLEFYHIIADTYGIMVFVQDFTDIYKSLKLNTPMPEPLLPLLPAWEDCWKYENSSKVDNDQAYWDNFFSSVPPSQAVTINGLENKKAVIPGKKYMNQINLLNTNAKQVNYRIPAELTKRINDFALDKNFSPKIIYLLALNTWLSIKSNDGEAFSYCDLIANRNKKMYSKTSGSFVDNITLYVDVKNDMPFADACKHLVSNFYKHIKHSRLNDIKTKRMLYATSELTEPMKFPWVRAITGFLFTYQPYFISCDEKELKMRLERFSSGKSPMPVYAMFMPTDNYTGEMNLNFEYTTVMHKQKDFDEFYSFMLKFLDEAITHPEKTIADLKNV